MKEVCAAFPHIIQTRNAWQSASVYVIRKNDV